MAKCNDCKGINMIKRLYNFWFDFDGYGVWNLIITIGETRGDVGV